MRPGTRLQHVEPEVEPYFCSATSPRLPVAEPPWLRQFNNGRCSGPGVIRRVRLLVKAVFGCIAVLALLLVGAVAYDSLRPPISTLMLAHRLAGEPVDRRWVPLSAISGNLLSAVVMSEDGQFCNHHGVDWNSLGSVVNDPDGPSRGASTITMQTAKNLFLWPSRSYVRKALEIPTALALELVWSKRDILEAYLNIAEWGRGVFGAEAAAEVHFHKPARELTRREAALLATSLPNPIQRNPARPTRLQRTLTATVLARMATSEPWLTCLKPGRNS